MHGLKQKQTARSHYRQFGEQLAHERVAMMEEQLSKFRKVLEDFAFRHKEDIKRDPIFRKHFHEMCASIGVAVRSGCKSVPFAGDSGPIAENVVLKDRIPAPPRPSLPRSALCSLPVPSNSWDLPSSSACCDANTSFTKPSAFASSAANLRPL